MPAECTHILSSGQKCQAPARTDSSFCHHHNPRTHLDPHPREPRESEPLVLPPLQDKCAILVAVSEVIHAASERRIRCSEARTLLMALKFASQLMTEIDETSTSEFESRQYPQLAQQEPTSKSTDPAHRNGNALTPNELDQYTQLLQNSAVQQLRHQTETKQKAWSSERIGSNREGLAVAAMAASGKHREPALSR
jgi:hypothetical protein